MPKYRVEIRRRMEERCFVEVEASDESDAEDIAIELALEDDNVEWDCIGGESEYAKNVEEIHDV